MSKKKPEKYTARLSHYLMEKLNASGEEYVRLFFQIEQNVSPQAVNKTYYLTSQAAREHLFDELGKMGQQVDSMYEVREALNACIGLRVQLKVKIGKASRTSYYILGRCNADKPTPALQ